MDEKDLIKQLTDSIEAQIDEEALKFLGDGSTLTTGPSTTAITLEDVIKVAEDLQADLEKPYRDLLSSKGFDPDRDWILFSIAAANLLGLREDTIPGSLRHRVKINAYCPSAVLLMKDPGIPRRLL